MNEYWKAPPAGVDEEEVEEAFPESGRPGCLSVFAMMLAAGGIGYGIVFGIIGLNLIVEGAGRPALGALIMVGAIPLALAPAIVAVGLWRLRMWAWWLTVILGSLGLGLGVASFVAALLGADPMRALGFVLGPLMGLFVGVVVLYWFLANRDRFGQRAAEGARGQPEEGRPGKGQGDADNALLIFAVTVTGCMTLFCLAAAVLLILPFVFGISFSGILRGLGLPAPYIPFFFGISLTRTLRRPGAQVAPLRGEGSRSVP